ncbi:MAG TPA: enoyl-CoA hydratase/isomerase family protein [Burkholderiaceae bacterium]|nr:enoyl-CoA hydratase/isomerase family protein [Burkholderiaceae bacterium]
MSNPEPNVLAERRGHLGIVTLNRPQALNALSLEMIRGLTAQLLAWRGDDGIAAVALRGAGRPGKAPAFCAGGDIRYFHGAALAGDPRLEDFFSEEYALNHLIHTFGKPTFVLMDGITMGGGMGLAQGCSMRIVTEHGKLAMPETNIGLFPDVGGGWFLAQAPGHLGEFLGLSGHVLGAADALAVGWADACVPADRLDALVQAIADATAVDGVGALSAVNVFTVDPGVAPLAEHAATVDRVFAAPDLAAIVAALAAEQGEFAAAQGKALAQRSPLMMAVTLEQIRRARTMTLADDLRMERGLVRRCFHLRPGAASETLEGIRALAVDKDHSPRWNPATVAEVDAAMVEAFFAPPWPAHAHPLRDLD